MKCFVEAVVKMAPEWTSEATGKVKPEHKILTCSLEAILTQDEKTLTGQKCSTLTDFY